MQSYYDAVIVGAGLSGLAAAWELKDRRVAVLEKEEVAGGRIKTGTVGGIPYELGAVFCLDKTLLPFVMSPQERLEESGRIGLLYNRQLFWGNGVMSCIGAVGGSLREEARNAFSRFHEGQIPNYACMSQACQQVLSAFFQVIHPGALQEYLPFRQRDACVKYDCAHWVKGNQTIIDDFLRDLSPQCEFWFNTAVEAVIQEAGLVRIICRQQEQKQELLARTVLVTVPAPLAHTMLTQIDQPCKSFLASITYGGGVVVAVGLQDAAMPDFAYVVTPQAATSTIIQHHTQDKHMRVLLVYYAGTKALECQQMADSEVIQATVRQLAELGFCQEQQVVFTDMQRWDYLGPIISQASYGQWSSQAAKPSNQVFLAGEYVAVAHGRNIMPYGMAAALEAGREQGRKARELLEAVEVACRYQEHFLVDVYTYRVNGSQPTFIRHAEEGNVAFYGLILQATRDERLQKYLLGVSRDGLWEYQTGFGVTAEDSVLVLEGLWKAGTDKEILLPSLRKLVEHFYDSNVGAFCTVREGRARYWQGSSPDATAMAGYLLACLAPAEFQTQIDACGQYLIKAQKEQGFWRGKWFPSYLLTTWYSLRLLSMAGCGENEAALAKGIAYVQRKQQKNGSWNHSVIDTSAALLALNQAYQVGHDDSPALLQAIDTARQWLVDSQATGQYGEPVLYYWNEEASWLNEKVGHTLFYHCQDKGQIAAAWRKIALRSGDFDEK